MSVREASCCRSFSVVVFYVFLFSRQNNVLIPINNEGNCLLQYDQNSNGFSSARIQILTFKVYAIDVLKFKSSFFVLAENRSASHNLRDVFVFSHAEVSFLLSCTNAKF